jgi:hypothetical protein
MPEPRETVAEVLRAHTRISTGCAKCGRIAPGINGWSAHVAAAVLAALELTEETERVQCYRPVNECTWSYGCGHDGTRSRFVTPWGCVHE